MSPSFEPSRQCRILFIDAYDSFAHNIVALLQSCGAFVVSIRMDDPRYTGKNFCDFIKLLWSFDGIVAGPGPGDPRKPECVGLIGRLWKLPITRPTLGICLGFQSLALSEEAKVEPLAFPRHGEVHRVFNCHDGLTNSTQETIQVVSYNSLKVVMGHDMERASHFLEAIEAYQDMWVPRLHVKPLFWDIKEPRNGRVLMGCKHTFKPFWGVQFHPESSECDEATRRIISTFVKEAIGPGDYTRRWPSPSELTDEELLSQVGGPYFQRKLKSFSSNQKLEPAYNFSKSVQWKCLNLELPVAALCRLLRIEEHDCVVLESAISRPLATDDGSNAWRPKPERKETARYSIIGLPHDATLKICYFLTNRAVEVRRADGTVVHRQEGVDIWTYLKSFMSACAATGGRSSIPFWGGLVGVVSYEACLDTFDVKSSPLRNPSRPDVIFLIVERSIVVDHRQNKTYIQSIMLNDRQWILDVSKKIADHPQAGQQIQDSSRPKPVLFQQAEKAYYTGGDKETLRQCYRQYYCTSKSRDVLFNSKNDRSRPQRPDQTEYLEKVSRCQSYINQGWAYQLCLTNTITTRRPKAPAEYQHSSWTYDIMRKRNPAPFHAYLKLGTGKDEVTLLSSSPERFMCWNRSSQCQFRPMKGTVRKPVPGSGEPPMTRADAEAALRNPKDQAENLMISDLIRNDLHGVIGNPAGVKKPRKIVEEYQTVWQLIAKIEGDFSNSTQRLPDGTEEPVTGIDVLAASLPPGSMTGAPKRKACELLREIEGDKPRSLYSGIVGYMDVGGGGDFSVVIRSTFKWADEDEDDERERHGVEFWHSGAGGAVTTKSEPVEEWKEMKAKLDVATIGLRYQKPYEDCPPMGIWPSGLSEGASLWDVALRAAMYMDIFDEPEDLKYAMEEPSDELVVARSQSGRSGSSTPASSVEEVERQMQGLKCSESTMRSLLERHNFGLERSRVQALLKEVFFNLPILD